MNFPYSDHLGTLPSLIPLERHLGAPLASAATLVNQDPGARSSIGTSFDREFQLLLPLI